MDVPLYFTGISLLNTGSDLDNLTLSAFDKEGNLLKQNSLEVPLTPGQKLISSVSDLFGSGISQETSWLKIESNAKLIGLGLIGTTDRLFSVPME